MPDRSTTISEAERRASEAMCDFTVCIRAGWHTVIAPRGELDLATVPRFEAACASIELPSVARAVLDLRDLVFIDVRGLRAVLRLHARCLEQSVELWIRPGPPAVQRMFELTGTHHLLPFSR